MCKNSTRMKKLFIGLFLLFLANGLKSQVLISILLGDKLNSPNLEFGLEGGVNYSDVMTLENKHMLSTFNVGFYFDILMKNHWYFYTGVLVKADMGASKLSKNDLDLLNIAPLEEEGTYSQFISYFMVPALAKYKFDNRIYLEMGPQFNLMHKPYVQFDATNDDIETRKRFYNTDDINRLDVGMVGGAGFKFVKGWGMSVGLKYYQGFIDVYKNRSGSKNQSLFLKVNIPIGAGKK